MRSILDTDLVIVFLILVIISGGFGFTGVVAGIAGIAMILFYVFLVLLVIALIRKFISGKPPLV